MRWWLLLPFLLLSGCSKDKLNGIPCKDLVNETLPGSDPASVAVPTAFTPDGDGLNDYFRPLAVNIQSLHMTIYDEAEKVIFESHDLNATWVPLFAVTTYDRYYYRVEAVTAGNHKIGLCGEFFALGCLPKGKNLSHFSFEDQYTPNGFTGLTAEQKTTCP